MDLNNIHISYTAYSRPFAKLFQTADKKISERKGFLIKLETSGANSAVSFGEAAPLEGYSQDDIHDVEKCLVGFSTNELLKKVEARELPSSLQFAFEGALAGIRGEVRSDDLDEPIESNVVISLAVNAESLATEIAAMIEKNYSTIKLKISPTTASFTIAAMEKISCTCEKPIRWRLDANHSFSSSEFADFLKKLEPFSSVIDYIEDPLTLTEEKHIGRFADGSVPLAVDQSVNSIARPNSLLDENNYKVFILKPTCLGGEAQTIAAVKSILNAKKTFTITSALETEIGRREVLRIACEVRRIMDFGKYPPIGLSTGVFFEKNFFQDSPVYDSAVYKEVSAEELQYLNSLSWKRIS